MSDWPEVYHLESVEQMRAASDDLRQRILEELVKQPLTVTQLGTTLNLAPAKIHYHVRELERVGLVKLVETREKGGILEKYYRTVARRLQVPRELFQRSSPEDPIAALQAMMDSSTEAFTRALVRSTSTAETDREHPLSLARTHLWLSEEEYEEFSDELVKLFDRYEDREKSEGARQYSFVHMMWETEMAEPESSRPEAQDPVPAVEPQTGVDTQAPSEVVHGARIELGRRTWAVGVIHLNRSDLERTVSEGKTLDITIMGVASFADDVTPELAERAIGRFKHRGKVSAAPAVLDVLARKEAATHEEAPM